MHRNQECFSPIHDADPTRSALLYPSITVKKLAATFLSRGVYRLWASRRWDPKSLLTDHGPVTAGKIITAMCDNIGTKKVFTAACQSPQCRLADWILESLQRQILPELWYDPSLERSYQSLARE